MSAPLDEDGANMTSTGRNSTDNATIHNVAAITVDPQIQYDIDNDVDTDYSDRELNDATFSVTSTIYNYREENGRTYHRYKDGAYLMPNDEMEKDRLDIVHHMYLVLLEGHLTLAPIDTEKPLKVLDVGTGTGIWAMAMADHLSEDSEAIGTDLSPIQPGWVPANCRFEIDDAENEWTYDTNHFDFIHTRHLSQSIRDWPAYISRLYDHLRPGGWIEIAEHGLRCYSDDGSFPLDSPLALYTEKLCEFGRREGFLVSSNPGNKLKEMVIQAGFTDVRHVPYNLPWGPWAEDERLKELGRWAFITFKTGAAAYGLALLTRVGGITGEDAQRICNDAINTLNDWRLHVYNFHHFIIARKPMPGEVVATV
ncbi:Similar to Phosphoethanolamine N-methyltransferase 3; acc. no. Q9C6B9 [Pyronema omphalodes CBS 100304]|uniref:Similar to Phosphoethanolamine N-methyltransferase 3 acc. no. Q9C6B9 n=1 Tax=Pyronema omphalodes (strain CBS 100304) TaxID=1076935 RepID=U4KZ29_PYROM|nr:Similar to Phosphoethanolamine N-methyltransferase 3; acc. no. Q9C6B9 [Pyronema omphalodes CBS 100304]